MRPLAPLVVSRIRFRRRALLGHAERDSRLGQRPLELGAHPGIFLSVWNAASALFQVGVVRDDLVSRFSLYPPVAAGDGEYSERFLADTEMLVKSTAAAWSGGD